MIPRPLLSSTASIACAVAACLAIVDSRATAQAAPASRLAADTLDATDASQTTRPAGRTIDAHMKDQPFKPQPTRTLADIGDFPPATALPDRTDFGGVKRYPPARATGFFRAQQIDGRWWLIDPTGHRTINAGVTSTNVGKLSPDGQAAFDRTFATIEAWARQTRDLLRSNGFDGTGCWSDDDRLRIDAEPPLIYTVYWPFMSKYGEQRGGTTAEAGHKGYPNKCIFVFDPQFAAFADEFAKGLTKFKDDRSLLGYFTDNELPFPLDALDRYLALPEVDPGRQAAEAFVAARQARRDQLTEDDRQAFMAVIADRYFSVVYNAVHKYDPNHLILGPRFHSTDHRNAALLDAAARHVDVIGYNLYGVWTPGPALLDRLSVHGKVPVLISEFYARADDAGLANTDGAGWTVRTQADRAAFYQNFALALLESRTCVGWHWFKYIDNDPAVAVGPTPNDSNKGILTNRFQPYAALLDAMRAINVSRYDLVEYFDARFRPKHAGD